MLHARTHPVPVDGCYGCKLMQVSIAPSAMPFRHPEAAGSVAMEGRWDKDMPAYKRLRRDGLQPPHIDGCAELEAKAETPTQVQTGLVTA